jgi:hypothetical protein
MPAFRAANTAVRFVTSRAESGMMASVCSFVDKRCRCQGLMLSRLQGAVGYAAANGAQIVEGYPGDPGGEQVSGGSTGFVGLASAYRKARFLQVARPNERHAIMRYYLGSASA